MIGAFLSVAYRFMCRIRRSFNSVKGEQNTLKEKSLQSDQLALFPMIGEESQILRKGIHIQFLTYLIINLLLNSYCCSGVGMK